MNFDQYFKLASYSVVFCGALALYVSDGIGAFITLGFIAALIFAFRLEETRWQFSERLGLVLIIFSLPLFYFDWQFLNASISTERAGAATLSHLILWLSLVKLLQKKNDRDWIFVYLISFFEVLLAAGLSITPLFLAVLILYLLFSICAFIAFEIRKTKREVNIVETAIENKSKRKFSALKLPLAAIGVLALITVFAFPLFFMMPRVGGAGFGRSNSGPSQMIGFSDMVKLGAIGNLQQNNQVVMRIRVEGDARRENLRWRGVALDSFDNKVWRNTRAANRTPFTNENGWFPFSRANQANQLTTQTVYLEPTDQAVLFGAPRIVAIQGNFPLVHRDEDEAVRAPSSFGRVSYKVFSDISQPDEKLLRADRQLYGFENSRYLQLPARLDSRIASFAAKIIAESRATNRYDAARALENYLQTQFGYTLEQKSGGSDDPLAKFLFEVREGHCEYFATALAIMLRTQGIATRVVNGFQTGNYNDAADAYVVTQSQAHSWVEVYFPQTESWVTFDATPPAGRNIDNGLTGGFLTSGFSKYLEAAEMFWLQYVVGYDNLEQRSLVRNLRNNLVETQTEISNYWEAIKSVATELFSDLRGEEGLLSSAGAIAKIILFLVLTAGTVLICLIGFRRLRRSGFWNIIANWRKPNEPKQVVLFYERMIHALEKRGFERKPQQTPLEFAKTLAMPEAVKITEAYHRVRFGKADLSQKETFEIESWLTNLETLPFEF